MIQPFTGTGRGAGCKDAGNEGLLTCRLFLALEKVSYMVSRGPGESSGWEGVRK